MRCPSCGAEYEDGVEVCADCVVELVPAVPGPASSESRLGRFEAPVAHVIAEALDRRDIPARVDPEDPWESGRRLLDVLVPDEHREDLRAELVTEWPSILARLDPDTQVAVRASGTRLPGWDDAPEGVWIDREGRLRASGSEDEEAEADEERTVGPGLVAAALLLLLLAWFLGDGMPRLVTTVAGVGLLVIGAFMPR